MSIHRLWKKTTMRLNRPGGPLINVGAMRFLLTVDAPWRMLPLIRRTGSP